MAVAVFQDFLGGAKLRASGPGASETATVRNGYSATDYSDTVASLLLNTVTVF